MALIDVGSYPVYACVEYSKSESGPPGQYTQTLPVMAMCGHRCGLDMTATTATPLAVRTGFCRRYGISLSRRLCGRAAMMSATFGMPCNLYLRAACDFKVERCAAVIRLHQLRHDMRDAQRVGRGPGICSVLSCCSRRRSASICRVSSHDRGIRGIL